jgi:hypothetical protein
MGLFVPDVPGLVGESPHAQLRSYPFLGRQAVDVLGLAVADPAVSDAQVAIFNRRNHSSPSPFPHHGNNRLILPVEGLVNPGKLMTNFSQYCAIPSFYLRSRPANAASFMTR